MPHAAGVPSGGITPISVILEEVFRHREEVKRALDVGVGFGKYGLLLREYLELWDGREMHKKADWLRTIDAIEVKREYIAPHQEYLYSHIFIGEAREVLAGLPDGAYDLVLLADVLEHFTKPQADEVLREVRRVSTWAIVSTPEEKPPANLLDKLICRPWDNKYELHRSEWFESDYDGRPFKVEFLPCPGYLIASLHRT